MINTVNRQRENPDNLFTVPDAEVELLRDEILVQKEKYEKMEQKIDNIQDNIKKLSDDINRNLKTMANRISGIEIFQRDSFIRIQMEKELSRFLDRFTQIEERLDSFEKNLKESRFKRKSKPFDNTETPFY